MLSQPRSARGKQRANWMFKAAGEGFVRTYPAKAEGKD